MIARERFVLVLLLQKVSFIVAAHSDTGVGDSVGTTERDFVGLSEGTNVVCFKDGEDEIVVEGRLDGNSMESSYFFTLKTKRPPSMSVMSILPEGRNEYTFHAPSNLLVRSRV